MSEAEKRGTFVVAEADEAAAVLRDAETSQVHTLTENPGFEAGEVVDATVAPEPPLEVAWEVVEVHDRRTVDLSHVDLEPTTRSHEVAGDEVGDLATYERAGEGEVHVLTVGAGEAEEAAEEVLADEATLARAARLGAVKVEVRTAETLVSVRYLPK